MTTPRTMRNPWVFLLLSLLSSAALFGQSSGIQGVVSDPTAAPVPDVKVIVTNVDTGVAVTATTNEHGFYTAPFLQTGNYRITAEKAGFSPLSRDHLRLNVDQIARVDFSLKIGAVAETVEVTATAALLESETTTVGQVIEQKRIVEMPLNLRNYLELAKIANGVLPARQLGRGVSCTGASTSSCETTSSTEPTSSPTGPGPRSRACARTNSEARSAVIVRNHTFFFFSYQGTRIRRGKSFLSTVPSQAARDGNFANEGLNRNRIYDPLTTAGTGAAAIRQPFPNNLIPATRFDPVTKPIIDLYPLPNVAGREFQPNNYFFAPSDIDDSNQSDIKIDHNFSDRDRTFFRWSIRRDDKLQNGPLPLSAFGGGLGQTVKLPGDN